MIELTIQQAEDILYRGAQRQGVRLSLPEWFASVQWHYQYPQFSPPGVYQWPQEADQTIAQWWDSCGRYRHAEKVDYIPLY